MPVTNNAWEYVPSAPLSQVYSSLQERAVALNDSVTIIEDYSVFYANKTNLVNWTNIVGTVTNTGTYTNTWVSNNVVHVTNCFDKFYTTDEGGNEVTNYAYLTQRKMTQIDAKINSLLPRYVSRYAVTNDMKEYLSRFFLGTNIIYGIPRETNYYTIHPYRFPMENLANALYKNNIGLVVTNTLTTNSWGHITGGDAKFTREPPHTNMQVLAEVSYQTNWIIKGVSSLDYAIYFETNNFPTIRYLSDGTNPIGSVDIMVTGTLMRASDRSLNASSELITLNSTNATPLTNLWVTLNNIVPSTFFNTGDTISVYYTGYFGTYGDYGGLPYTLYKEDINERWRVITNMVWTCSGKPYITNNIGRYSCAAGGEVDTTLVGAFSLYYTAWPTNYDYTPPTENLWANDWPYAAPQYLSIRAYSFRNTYGYPGYGYGVEADRFTVSYSFKDRDLADTTNILFNTTIPRDVEQYMLLEVPRHGKYYDGSVTNNYVPFDWYNIVNDDTLSTNKLTHVGVDWINSTDGSYTYDFGTHIRNLIDPMPAVQAGLMQSTDREFWTYIFQYRPPYYDTSAMYPHQLLFKWDFEYE